MNSRSCIGRILIGAAAGLALGSAAIPLRAASKPTVTTQPADGIGQTSAPLHASVNPNGAATLARFQYAAGATNDVLATTVTQLDTGNSTGLAECTEAALRAAVAAGGLVRFACDGTITLSNTLVVTQDTVLDANGHQVTISGRRAVRLFQVASGVRLHLIGLTLADGKVTGTNSSSADAPGGSVEGAAILASNAIVAASQCLFRSNVVRGGDGGSTLISPRLMLASEGGDGIGGTVSARGGELRLTNCLFLANEARGGDGGWGFNPMTFRNLGGLGRGAAVAVSGTSAVVACTFVSNRVIESSDLVYSERNAGGAIYVGEGAALVQDSRFDGNSAPAGGAVANAGRLDLTNCALVRNVAKLLADYPAPAGGAIYNAGQLSASSSTLAENEAGGTNILGGLGGALANVGGTASMHFCTMASNRIPRVGAPPHTAGGGLWIGGGTVALQGCILAGNWMGSSPANVAGSIQDLGYNLSSDETPIFTQPTSRSNTDPLLAPLDDYGGPTPTMALLAGSPAIDAAELAWCPPTDQRGRPRPFGAACDIGAFETSAPYTVRGRLTGYLVPPGSALVTCPPATSPADPATGRYVLWGLPGGDQVITPIANQAVFEPTNKMLTLTADVVGLNFHAWRSNAITIRREGRAVFRNVLAGESGATWQVMVSTNLPHWAPYATYSAPASGLVDFWITNSPALPPLFFKAHRP